MVYATGSQTFFGRAAALVGQAQQQPNLQKVRAAAHRTPAQGSRALLHPLPGPASSLHSSSGFLGVALVLVWWGRLSSSPTCRRCMLQLVTPSVP